MKLVNGAIVFNTQFLPWCNRQVCCAPQDSAVWHVAVKTIVFCKHHNACQKMFLYHSNLVWWHLNFVVLVAQLKRSTNNIDGEWICISTKISHFLLTDSMDGFHVSVEMVLPNKWFVTFCAGILFWYLTRIMHTQMSPQSYCCYTIFLANATSATKEETLFFSNFFCLKIVTYTKISGLKCPMKAKRQQ